MQHICTFSECFTDGADGQGVPGLATYALYTVIFLLVDGGKGLHTYIETVKLSEQKGAELRTINHVIDEGSVTL